MQLYNTEKIKTDVRDYLNASTDWTVKPTNIALERDEKLSQENWMSNNDSTVLIKEVDDSYMHFLNLDGGINTVILAIEVHCDTKDLMASVANDVMTILRKPSLGAGYIDVIFRSTQQRSTEFRNIFQVTLMCQVRFHYTAP